MSVAPSTSILIVYTDSQYHATSLLYRVSEKSNNSTELREIWGSDGVEY
jgi:hypothetical protein